MSVDAHQSTVVCVPSAITIETHRILPEELVYVFHMVLRISSITSWPV
jgi:hypothetical protein